MYIDHSIYDTKFSLINFSLLSINSKECNPTLIFFYSTCTLLEVKLIDVFLCIYIYIYIYNMGSDVVSLTRPIPSRIWLTQVTFVQYYIS
ncbi:LOW QUALITY PROTEIN: hypothetical protein TorRG33x02_058130 [Trema orientale]|uniref:Uncharacterized protein n=1 Tax=Trema orientale TaxID=63057 RepID=A0A2P5FLC5_TREOI|nr:LOW QUALITY PROTEIN: hypothetical protein TorRG33x02_058130 [Trema orientale]